MKQVNHRCEIFALSTYDRQGGSGCQEEDRLMGCKATVHCWFYPGRGAWGVVMYFCSHVNVMNKKVVFVSVFHDAFSPSAVMVGLVNESI